MTTERYLPAEIEDKWYQHWMAQNRFLPSMDKDAESFCIVIPPPNVTGSLHLGHAWDETVQDMLIRWKRMCGYNTLWIPGTDHAGIATQWMVERILRDRGTSKEELGREKFLEEVWRFKEASHETIASQLRRLGVSCDWSRERFTLDEGLSRAVRRVFVSLFREGLIYRDHRMVSWCPRCLTALSDLEVNHKEHDSFMYHFRYPMVEGEGYVAVATTRPETMLGDGAVAVHPSDERYTAHIGRKVLLPLVEREIPIIADEYPDPAMGSGAVKITAAHDPNDFEVGKRHNVPMYIIMHEDGRMNETVPERYRERDRFEVRKLVIADLERLGLLDKTERHVHAVGHCSRCDTVVEPMLSRQWFVSMKDMAAAAVQAVEDGRINLVPDWQKKVFYEWMNNIQDWCISRQLWWGHRIPVWYCQPCGEVIASEEDITICPVCGSDELEMDQDVLDTWFSSGLWPFSTMGWPEQTEDLRTFYPTAVLVTGYDILFFWVARMAMLGIKFMDEVPFREVLLHGLLRDQHGEKMSKTKGNGLDPLEMIEQYGADALRFSLAAGTVPGRDMVLAVSTIEGYRNFINKIWNAARFTLSHVERLGRPTAAAPEARTLFDRWILGRLQDVAGEVNRLLDERRFNEAAKELYGFVWGELCDWYLEIIKPVLYGDEGPERNATLDTLVHVMGEALKLLHPIMPFVTEELWSRLQPAGGSIMVQPYPTGDAALRDGTAMAEAARLIGLIQCLRTVRGENGLKPKQEVDVVVAATDSGLRELFDRHRGTIATLVAINALELVERFDKQEGFGHGVGPGFEVFLSLRDLINVDQERQRIGRERDKAQQRIRQIAGKLDNAKFVEKAPADVVAKNREELDLLEEQVHQLTQSLEQLPPG